MADRYRGSRYDRGDESNRGMFGYEGEGYMRGGGRDIDRGGLYAGTRGRLFCLDRTTGSILWTNELSGLGYNLISFSGSSATAAIAADVAQIQADAAAAVAAASS